MKIIHTADLHFGQILYQNYDRGDEHAHFFAQLEKWCVEEKPDALLVCGDVFDIQQPSAAVKKAFNEHFVRLLKKCPQMRIMITAGNHDSASRLEADGALWALGNVNVVGQPPPVFSDETSCGNGGDWREKFIVRLESGYVIAMPHMPHGWRLPQVQSLLDKVAEENVKGKPVVLTGHLAVAGADAAGHDFEIGNLKTVPATELGRGYDYLALGHIHRPQTLGQPLDADCVPAARIVLPAPVRRYSGSCLRVSCDEEYPHSVSLVEIDRHGGSVAVTPLRIDELRRFYVLPEDGASFASAEDAVAAVKRFAEEKRSGYFRLRVKHDADLPPDFNLRVYDAIAPSGDEVRYNPKILWIGAPADGGNASAEPAFEIAELQQMLDPMEFIERTLDQYPGLDLDEVRGAFAEVKAEAARLAEKKSAGTPRAAKRNAGNEADADSAAAKKEF